MNCLHCEVPLEDTKLKGVEVSQCPECEGIWLKSADVPRFLATLVEAGVVTPEPLLPTGEPVLPAKPSGHACPECDAELWKRDFDYNTHIIVHRCEDCGHVWLGADQLPALASHGATVGQWTAIAKEIDSERYVEMDDIPMQSVPLLVASAVMPVVADTRTTSITPWLTLGLLLANSLAYAWLWWVDFTVPVEYLLIPGASLSDNYGISLVTHMFLHAGLIHFVGNMIFLWVFGDNVEEEFGHRTFLLFYLLSGLGAAAFHIFRDMDSATPMVGASGAIAGVMGAHLVFHPRDKILLMYRFARIKVSVWVAMIFWGLQQAYFAYQESQGYTTYIAWDAHVAGFFVGVLIALVFRALTRKSGGEVATSVSQE